MKTFIKKLVNWFLQMKKILKKWTLKILRESNLQMMHLLLMKLKMIRISRKPSLRVKMQLAAEMIRLIKIKKKVVMDKKRTHKGRIRRSKVKEAILWEIRPKNMKLARK